MIGEGDALFFAVVAEVRAIWERQWAAARGAPPAAVRNALLGELVRDLTKAWCVVARHFEPCPKYSNDSTSWGLRVWRVKLSLSRGVWEKEISGGGARWDYSRDSEQCICSRGMTVSFHEEGQSGSEIGGEEMRVTATLRKIWLAATFPQRNSLLPSVGSGHGTLQPTTRWRTQWASPRRAGRGPPWGIITVASEEEIRTVILSALPARKMRALPVYQMAEN